MIGECFFRDSRGVVFFGFLFLVGKWGLDEGSFLEGGGVSG